MRKLSEAWSATGSPRPVLGIGLDSVKLQLLMVPVRLAAESAISRVQVPIELIGPPKNRSPNGCCGLKRPVKGGPAAVMGVVALSSMTVLVKLASVPVLPTWLNRVMRVPLGAINVAVRSGSTG